jgi:hypothetical protein
MTSTLRIFCLSATAFTLAVVPSFAEDAMAPAGAMSAMTPMSDGDFKLCNEQAATMTFPEARQAALAACHGLHEGMDVMGAIKSLGMETDAMAPAAQ